jgi:hypothetical protein
LYSLHTWHLLSVSCFRFFKIVFIIIVMSSSSSSSSCCLSHLFVCLFVCLFLSFFLSFFLSTSCDGFSFLCMFRYQTIQRIK